MILIFIGLLFLYLGSEALVRGSSNLALRFGIPPLIVGLTIVAFGTSAPELVVSISAALKNSSGVAVGNVVGSNIFNIAAILGFTALIRPPSVHLDFVRREIPILIVVSTAAAGLIAFGHVSRVSGIALIIGLFVYTISSIRRARNEKIVEAMHADKQPSLATWICLTLVALGLGFLIWGSQLFVAGAVTMARSLGVSEATIGLTIVAAGTSLPELATSVVAAFKRESDIAIGNIIGSNLFNILCILGVTATIRPIQVVDIGVVDLSFMLGLSMLLLPFAFTQRTISRLEGLVFLVLYGSYLYILWP